MQSCGSCRLARKTAREAAYTALSAIAFCPSCGARRMAESAAMLVDEILPEAPIRQWVLSFPYALRFLFATRPTVMGKVLGIVYRTLAAHQVRKAGCTRRRGCGTESAQPERNTIRAGMRPARQAGRFGCGWSPG